MNRITKDVLPKSEWPWLAEQLRAWPERRVHPERTMSIGSLLEMTAAVVESSAKEP